MLANQDSHRFEDQAFLPPIQASSRGRLDFEFGNASDGTDDEGEEAND